MSRDAWSYRFFLTLTHFTINWQMQKLTAFTLALQLRLSADDNEIFQSHKMEVLHAVDFVRRFPLSKKFHDFLKIETGCQTL